MKFNNVQQWEDSLMLSLYNNRDSSTMELRWKGRALGTSGISLHNKKAWSNCGKVMGSRLPITPAHTSSTKSNVGPQKDCHFPNFLKSSIHFCP